MKSEIGSDFWIESAPTITNAGLGSPSIFNCGGSDYVWTSSGRSATELVIQTIEERNPAVRKVACLPAFTCHTVFEPFVRAGYAVVTLPNGTDMMTSASELLSVVREAKAGVVLLHRYFGFDTLPDVERAIVQLRHGGVVVIEDCTQSMYSGFPRIDADYFVGSIRKWCGVPDGGVAVCKEGTFTVKPHVADRVLEDLKVQASERKRKYIEYGEGDKDEFLMLYRKAEDTLDAQSHIYSISPTSIAVQSNLDVARLKQKRRVNYQYLLQSLASVKQVVPIFSEMADEVVPLYLPVLCEDRPTVRRILISQAIYAPIVWPKDDHCPAVCREADYIYEHILCIPIDQRYDLDDMQRVADVLMSI